jgi:hypothetical protein
MALVVTCGFVRGGERQSSEEAGSEVHSNPRLHLGFSRGSFAVAGTKRCWMLDKMQREGQGGYVLVSYNET